MAVAGAFYPANPNALTEELDRYLNPPAKRQDALGCVVPHAGILYSGHVAGAVYSRLALTETVIILCPNHTGHGRPLAILSEGAWETPLGPVPVDTPLATALMASFPNLEEDTEAHRREHSLEVQLPFLRKLQPKIRMVPIALGTGRLETLETLGNNLARVLMDLSPRPLIIASSDMNHFEADKVSRQKDKLAIDRVLDLDPKGLHETVQEHNISMCGYGPAIAMLTATRMLGAASAELVRYANSGEITGDTQSVVGYAGIIVQ
jgi:AmmeMemoRadiSam system protein B